MSKNSVSLTYSVALAYKDIFNDHDSINIANLLADIPTKNGLQIVAHFLAQLHANERGIEQQIEFLRIWIGRLPAEVYPKIYEFIYELSQKPNATFNFINNVGALILISRILENWNELPPVENLTPEQELQLFKAYLYCNQEWTDKQKAPAAIQSAEDLTKMLLPIQMPYAEILEFKDFRFQIIKAIHFFKFCEINPIFSDFLTRFIAFYNLKSWQEYLLNLLNAYVRKFEISIPSVLQVGADFPEAIEWFDTMSIKKDSFQPHDDFKSIREAPIFKLSEDTFLFLNLNFLVDKIFQGVQFDFAKALLETKAEYKGKRIKDFGTFRSIYGDEFSEVGLFYKTLDYTFEKSGYTLIPGNKLKPILVDGEPDYYIRDKSKIYLFEYKDVILNSKVKHSYNYESIKEEIFTKMVENQKGSSKGVSQLVNIIKRLLTGGFEKVDRIDLANLIIYPIIVFTDFSFNLPGTNYILNEEFRSRLKTAGVMNDSNIKNCVIIDLDLLIKFQDLFRDKTLKLNNCINEYIDLTSQGMDMSKVSSFSMYLHQKTSKIEYHSPKLLMDELRQILPSDNKS